MLDFSRLWPPEVPTRGLKASFLIRKMREELVRGFDRPLCSDAFSGFQKGEGVHANNNDIADAFRFLADHIIPSFTTSLGNEIQDPSAIQRFDLTSNMHEKGTIPFFKKKIQRNAIQQHDRIHTKGQPEIAYLSFLFLQVNSLFNYHYV